MPYSDAALEDESLPPPEASPTRAPQSRGVFDPDSTPLKDRIDPLGRPRLSPGEKPFASVDGRPYGTPPPQPQPQPQPAPYEPYIPSPTRPHTQWGTTDFPQGGGVLQGPYMPQPRDLAPLLHSIVTGMGRYGSFYSGMPAIAMGTYASAYWSAYQKGLKERASENWQKYRQAHQMFLDRAKQENLEAAEGYALYPNDPEKLKQYMMQLATKYHDQALLNQLAVNPAGLEELWKKRDAHWHDAAKIAEQQRRAEQEEERRKQLIEQTRIRMQIEKEKRDALERARKAIDPNAAGPGPGYVPDFGPSEPGSDVPPEPDETPGAGDEEGGGEGGAEAAPDVPSDTATDEDTSQKPIQVADASGQVPIGRGIQPEAQKEGPEGKEETPVLENAAKNWVTSHKLPDSLKKKGMEDLAARAEARGAAIESYLNKLAADPKTTPDKTRNEVRRLLPGFANNLDGYISGDLAPPRAIGASNQAYWNLVYNLGRKIDPTFNSDTHNERAKGRIFWTSGPGGVKLTTVGTAFRHLLDLRQLTLDGQKPMQLTGGWSEWWALHFGEAGEFRNTLGTAMHEYENALAASGASGGGSATIPAMKHQEKELDPNQSDYNFLKDIDSKIKLLSQRLEELHSQYVTSTGRPAQEIQKRFDEYAKKAAPSFKDTDPSFSENLLNAPERLRALSRYGREGDSAPKPGTIDSGWKFKGGDPSKRENWERQ